MHCGATSGDSTLESQAECPPIARTLVQAPVWPTRRLVPGRPPWVRWQEAATAAAVDPSSPAVPQERVWLGASAAALLLSGEPFWERWWCNPTFTLE